MPTPLPEDVQPLSPASKLVYLALVGESPRTTHNIAEAAALSDRAVLNGVEKLREIGLAETFADPEDGRRDLHKLRISERELNVQ